MGAFLFVYIPRQTKNVVRPSYDGHTLMGKVQTGGPFTGYVCILHGIKLVFAIF